MEWNLKSDWSGLYGELKAIEHLVSCGDLRVIPFSLIKSN